MAKVTITLTDEEAGLCIELDASPGFPVPGPTTVAQALALKLMMTLEAIIGEAGTLIVNGASAEASPEWLKGVHGE